MCIDKIVRVRVRVSLWLYEHVVSVNFGIDTYLIYAPLCSYILFRDG